MKLWALHVNMLTVYYLLSAQRCQSLDFSKIISYSPWYNIDQGYHWEGLFASFIIGKLNISRFQIQLIAVSYFPRWPTFDKISPNLEILSLAMMYDSNSPSSWYHLADFWLVYHGLILRNWVLQ